MNAIAILHYKTDEMTSRLVESIGGDVYVVVNGCTYSGPGIKIWLHDNLYFTGGWNAAMDILSDHEYVWMLNSDVEGPTQEMFASIISEFSGNTAVITPAFNSPHAIFESPGVVPWIDWCAPVVRMEVWKKVGPFDTAFKGYGADIDWCMRASGYQFLVSENRINHLGSVTASTTGNWQQNNYNEMVTLLRRKYNRDWQELIK